MFDKRGAADRLFNTAQILFLLFMENFSIPVKTNQKSLEVIFNYNGNDVSFIKTDYGVLINATQMAKPYNTKPAWYLRQEAVNQLIKSMVHFLHLSEDQIVKTVNGAPSTGGGTWFHEDLAIDFAQWLDIDFKLWCNHKIKELLATGSTNMPNFSNPAEAARAWADAYEAQQKALREKQIALAKMNTAIALKEEAIEEKKQAIKTIEQQRPDVEFSQSYIDPEGEIIMEVSKRLENFGYIIAAKRLYDLLSKIGFIFRGSDGKWRIYERARMSGYMKYGKIQGDEFYEDNPRTSKVTNKGFKKILELMDKKRRTFSEYGRFVNNE